MKKAISFVLALLLLSTSFITFARASNQISSYGVGVVAEGNGKIKVNATIWGTHFNMIEIGFPDIILYERNSNDDGWNSVALKSGKYNPNTPAGSYNYSFTYQGTAGKKYYAAAAFFAKDAEGETSRRANSFVETAT
ncbi:MAG: hypothetical protein LBR76_01770 [Oscillospiraceae bacterium]|jgi:hypothetical protein|nr:hypothetical protein [Oscillospiraceae bacterium]